MARAANETRPRKRPAVPLAVLRARWRTAAVRVFGAERVDQLLALARRAAAAIRAAARPLVDLARAAADVAAVVYVHRGRFRRRHLAHELRGQRAEPGLDERIVAAALAHCRALTTPVGPLAGEHTAYTLTLADQLPRRPPAGARVTASAMSGPASPACASRASPPASPARGGRWRTRSVGALPLPAGGWPPAPNCRPHDPRNPPPLPRARAATEAASARLRAVEGRDGRVRADTSGCAGRCAEG